MLVGKEGVNALVVVVVVAMVLVMVAVGVCVWLALPSPPTHQLSTHEVGWLSLPRCWVLTSGCAWRLGHRCGVAAVVG